MPSAPDQRQEILDRIAKREEDLRIALDARSREADGLGKTGLEAMDTNIKSIRDMIDLLRGEL